MARVVCVLRVACLALLTLTSSHGLRTGDFYTDAVVHSDDFIGTATLDAGSELEMEQTNQAEASAVEQPDAVTVWIRPDDWCTKAGPSQREVCIDGNLKQKLRQPYMTISQLETGLVQLGRAWFHRGPLNGWSGLSSAYLLYLYCRNEYIDIDRIFWRVSSMERPVEALRSKSRCQNFGSIWRLPGWMRKGFTESAPGFFLWFSPALTGVPQRILLGHDAIQSDSNLLSQEMKLVALWDYKFSADFYHAILLIEWEEQDQPVTLVDLQQRYSSALRTSKYYEDGLSEYGRYAAAWDETVLEVVRRPVLEDWAEVRMLDLDVKNLTDFLSFVSSHSRSGSNDTRFTDAKLLATDEALLTKRTRFDIITMVLRYLFVDDSYHMLTRNSQTFAIGLFAAITGTSPEAAFLTGTHPKIQDVFNRSAATKHFFVPD